MRGPLTRRRPHQRRSTGRAWDATIPARAARERNSRSATARRSESLIVRASRSHGAGSFVSESVRDPMREIGVGPTERVTDDSGNLHVVPGSDHRGLDVDSNV